MKTFKTAPARGDFTFQQLVAPYQVTGQALNDVRGFFGLLLSKSMPFGSVRDEEGHIYSFVRSVMAPTGTPNPTRFFYQSTRVDGQHIRMDHPRMAAQALTPMPVQWLDNDTVHWTSQPGEPGNPWALEASGEHLRWCEEGLFELQGKLIGTGMQWYLPGVDWGTFYTSQLWDIHGVCEGRAVKGIMALDQVYLAEGGAIHFKKDLVVNNQKHVIWWSFATLYKDGSFDAGSFMVGHDNLGYALFMNERGEVRTTTAIEGLVRHKEGSYFVDTAHITLEGLETWEFLPDPKGEMIDFVGGFPITAQQEGRWRRVGDTREPDRWFAWGESDRRNGSARDVFGSDVEGAFIMTSALERFVHGQADCWNAGDREGFFAHYRRIAPEGLTIEYVGKPPIADAWAVLQSMWAQQSARIEVDVVVGIANGAELACHNRNRLRDGSGAIDTIELYRLDAGKLHVRYFIAPAL